MTHTTANSSHSVFDTVQKHADILHLH